MSRIAPKCLFLLFNLLNDWHDGKHAAVDKGIPEGLICPVVWGN